MEVVTKSVELVEEENPDCVILVYAVDDRATFGKRHKNIMFGDYQNHFLANFHLKPSISEFAKDLLVHLQGSGSLAGKSSILVGNKADLMRR